MEHRDSAQWLQGGRSKMWAGPPSRGLTGLTDGLVVYPESRGKNGIIMCNKMCATVITTNTLLK